MLPLSASSVGDGIELRLDGLAQYELETARELCAEIEGDQLQLSDRPVGVRGTSARWPGWADRRRAAWRCAG